MMNHTSGAMPMLLEHTTVTVKINEDASAEVICNCSDLGTGAHTVLQQIAAETMGFPMDDVHMLVQNSDAAGFEYRGPCQPDHLCRRIGRQSSQ